ncbi:MAG: peptidylprolyl isomerase [Bacteroidetes bacterium]|nr:peptidylprolyl isomerase [Bacteroidota bacterium]MCW5894720.1 peptidylprolyl isomerase [Bacteroidota bacterium]
MKNDGKRNVIMKTWLPVLFLACLVAVAEAQVLDRIVAVIDKEMILESELNAQTQFFITTNKLDPNTPGLREQVLQSMINEKLILAKAIEDSVTVSEDEVTQQLDAIVRQRVQAAGSEQRLEELYGMPISRIKREYRDEMKKNLLSQRLQQQRFGGSQISRLEVEEFFRTYQDSLGEVPEEVELAHIFVRPKFGETEKAESYGKMKLLLDSIKAGVPFEDLARRHSQDPGSAAQGGELGFVRRGLFVKDFETAVFSLKEQEVSGIVETEFGLHIIQLLERRGDAVHARHILMRIERTEASDDSAKAYLNGLRTRILAGESFAEIARKFSEDKETASIGGNLGTFELEQLPKELYPVVSPLKSGEISEPVRIPVGTQYGYSIVWVRERTPEHKANLDQDYKRIEIVASNYKRQKDYAAWLESLRKSIYWESRL